MLWIWLCSWLGCAQAPAPAHASAPPRPLEVDTGSDTGVE
jgi:hypothetical protein